MSGIAYIDSSCIVAIAAGEPTSSVVASEFRSFDSIVSHPLLDAEVRSACSRENIAVPQDEIDIIEFVEAKRAISDEIDRVLLAGYLRGADCLHVATALYLSPDARQLTFLTLDTRQRAVARTLGFKV